MYFMYKILIYHLLINKENKIQYIIINIPQLYFFDIYLCYTINYFNYN
jgi:hypothetical protein